MCTRNGSHDIWFLRYQVQRTDFFFVILDIFLPIYPLKTWKIKILKKQKKAPGDIIILNKCTKNYDQMVYCSWDMARGRCNCYFLFWAIFCPFTPNLPKKWKFQQKKEKNTSRYHHFTQVYQKSWSHAILFLRYEAWWM